MFHAVTQPSPPHTPTASQGLGEDLNVRTLNGGAEQSVQLGLVVKRFDLFAQLLRDRTETNFKRLSSHSLARLPEEPEAPATLLLNGLPQPR